MQDGGIIISGGVSLITTAHTTTMSMATSITAKIITMAVQAFAAC